MGHKQRVLTVALKTTNLSKDADAFILLKLEVKKIHFDQSQSTASIRIAARTTSVSTSMRSTPSGQRQLGLVFRRLHPERVQYTYWDYYRKAVNHNWGWRVDHILETTPLAEKVPRRRSGFGTAQSRTDFRDFPS